MFFCLKKVVFEGFVWGCVYYRAEVVQEGGMGVKKGLLWGSRPFVLKIMRGTICIVPRKGFFKVHPPTL